MTEQDVREIHTEYMCGKTVSRICKEHYLAYSWLYKCFHRYGLPLRGGHKPYAVNQDEAEEISRMRAVGKKWAVLEKRYGYSERAMRNAIAHYGLKTKRSADDCRNGE